MWTVCSSATFQWALEQRASVLNAKFTSIPAEYVDALPSAWSHANPVDILGDATSERYEAAVASCLEDPDLNGVLVMLTPQAMTEPDTGMTNIR